MQDIETSIEGFYFEDEAVARQAMKEYMYIEKMQDKVSALKPDDLKEFYHKLIDKHIFSTHVGLTYLYEIRSTLVDGYKCAEEDLEEIVIPAVKQESSCEETVQKALEEITALKRTKTLLLAAIGILVVVIIGFFVIIATNENIGYINTENKILNKYSQWQEELDAREQALDEREQALEEGESTKENIDVE